MLFRRNVIQAKCYLGESVLGEMLLGESVLGEMLLSHMQMDRKKEWVYKDGVNLEQEDKKK